MIFLGDFEEWVRRFWSSASESEEVGLIPTHRPLSSSFLGVLYRILNINHKKELLRGLWVDREAANMGKGPCSFEGKLMS